jgi:superfamily II RNA helicase
LNKEHTTYLLAQKLKNLEVSNQSGADAVLDTFLTYISDLGLEPYPAQEEAILELLSHKHVILNTPTGSGKSLVALALHFIAMANSQSSFYTAPTKALVNEKFFSLCDSFGAKNVGLLTGDASVNQDAPIICCTAEILSNMALRQENPFVDFVVMDEFHYYGDRDRGIAWQIPLISMKNTVFLLMSATLGDTSTIEKQLSDFSNRDVAVVKSFERPVPLEFEYRDTPLHETIEDLVKAGESPIYLVNFTQRACAEVAQNLCSINVSSKDDKKAIANELESATFDTPYGKEFTRFIRQGIGIHHAGLLPKYRLIVEKLAQSGLIKIISGTDTLGVGVNIPIRTVLIRQLYKFDGEKTSILKARDFHQISGRAGRKGFDDHGRVVVQAPEWTIENRRIDAKLQANPNLKKKLRRKSVPPRALNWDKKTFEKLLSSQPEPLQQQFQVNHGLLINLFLSNSQKVGGGYQRLLELISRSHGTELERKRRRKQAKELFQSLRLANIVEIVPGPQGAFIQVREDLQEDFSLLYTLSLYLVETIELIDQKSESYALDVLSLVESILENPNVILWRQIDKIKSDLVAKMKAEGVEYEERMERLEKVEHRKPNADFTYDSFNAFSKTHPWMASENIRPKSIAREMFERCMGFNEYVLEYGLARSEGVLLRYLSQVYKVAVQTVPEPLWTEEFEDILTYFHELVLKTDSSLIDEWELLVAGPSQRKPTVKDSPAAEKPKSIVDDPRAFAARIRNELHMLLKAIQAKDYELACTLIHQSEENEWTAEMFAEAMEPYYQEHQAIDITPLARQTRNTIFIKKAPRLWKATQKIIDFEGDHDWVIDCQVDMTRPRDESLPLIELLDIGN